MFFKKQEPSIPIQFSLPMAEHEYYYGIIHRLFSKYIINEMSILKSNPTLTNIREDNLFPSILYHVSTLYVQIPDVERYIMDTENFKSYSRLLDTIARISVIVPQTCLLYFENNFRTVHSKYVSAEETVKLLNKYPWWYLLPIYQDAFEDTVIYAPSRRS